MMIQMKSHPHPLFLVVLLHPQEEAVKSLIRVPPILFYAISYELPGNVCTYLVKGLEIIARYSKIIYNVMLKIGEVCLWR